MTAASVDRREPTDPLLQLLAEIAAEGRALGCDEADLRAVDRELDWLTMRNGELQVRTLLQDRGVGVRVRVHGSRGYAACQTRDATAVRGALRRAVAVARAAEPARRPEGAVAPPFAEVGTWASPTPGGDPFAVPLEARVDRLRVLHDALASDERIVMARATQVLLRRRTRLATLAGARLDQTVTLHGGGIMALAEAHGQLQQRSFPKDFEGNVLLGGEEIFERLELDANTARVREEAIALCSAPPCPEERTNLILDGAQLALQIHESVGHPTEGDRVLREELSLAGSSFATPDLLGGAGAEAFQYGSERVNLVADATTPDGPGTFAWDDEGTPAGRVDLVRDGRFVGYLNDRGTSARLGCAPVSACRAESWDAEPIVRMININLEPGDAGSLEDLVAATDRGVLMDVNRSWSIDDHRLNFQFGAEAAWAIRGGRRAELLRNPVYTGITPAFWRSCDAIGGREAWRMWGFLFCGKGDPIQIMHVGHGTAPARFRDVQVRAS